SGGAAGALGQCAALAADGIIPDLVLSRRHQPLSQPQAPRAVPADRRGKRPGRSRARRRGGNGTGGDRPRAHRGHRRIARAAARRHRAHLSRGLEQCRNRRGAWNFGLRGRDPAGARQTHLAPAARPDARRRNQTMSMTLAGFQRALDAFGADLAHWPQSQRIAAERLMASDPAAVAAFAQARALDALIARDATSMQADPTGVLRRLEARPLPPQRRRFLWRQWPTELLNLDFAPAWPRPAPLAALAPFGFALRPTPPGPVPGPLGG